MRRARVRRMVMVMICAGLGVVPALSLGQGTQAKTAAPAQATPTATIIPNASPSGSYKVIGRGQRVYDDPKAQQQYDAWVKQQQEKRTAFQEAGRTVVTVTPITRSTATQTLRREKPTRSSGGVKSAARSSGEGIEIDVEAAGGKPTSQASESTASEGILLQVN